jgi:hypothetical protein
MVPNQQYFTDKKLNNPTTAFSHVPGGKYKGDWYDNKKEGFGTLTYSNGDVYEGEFRADKREGKGTFYKKHKKGGKLKKQYAGDWVADKREGRGVCLSVRGRYEGSWANNKQNGAGKMVYEDGEVYEGEWENGVRSGMGVLLLASGDKYEGMYVRERAQRASEASGEATG